MTEIILSEINNGLGIITLNSPKNLNSISLDMAQALLNKLVEWKNNKDVQCIFLQGNEKSFCAGGDLKFLYQAIKNNPLNAISEVALEFFIKEYTLDYMIHTYRKPIIAWGDGIVMGGGLGLLAGASHRVVTEKTILAMPEITIGLYPDVGATWFLNRMPDGWGNYFGLTGARMNGVDAQYLGLADFYISSDLKTSLIDKLITIKWNKKSEENKKILDKLLLAFVTKNNDSPVKERKNFAERLSKINSVLEFRLLLEEISLQDEWIHSGLKFFKAGSPTSAMVIFEQLKRGKNLNLKEIFYSELNLSVQFSLDHDFLEGMRALIIDKDQKPNWVPATIEEVTSISIDNYFASIWSDLDHPLIAAFSKLDSNS